MPPPPQKPALAVNLSDAEFRALQDFAQANGISVEDAASLAAQHQLQARYVVGRRSGTVLNFKR